MRGLDLLTSLCDQEEVCLKEIDNLSMRHINYLSLQVFNDMRVAVTKEIILTVKSVFEEPWTEGHTRTWTKLFDWISMNLIQNYSADGHLTLTIWDSWLHIEALKNEDDSGGFGDALIFQLSLWPKRSSLL